MYVFALLMHHAPFKKINLALYLVKHILFSHFLSAKYSLYVFNKFITLTHTICFCLYVHQVEHNFYITNIMY